MTGKAGETGEVVRDKRTRTTGRREIRRKGKAGEAGIMRKAEETGETRKTG